MNSATDISNNLNNLQNSTAKQQAENNKRNMGSSELGQDAFLQLLMVQLKNQDPMNPMDNQEFIAQQAQFTQVSELQKLNSSLIASNSLMQSSNLIGKEVTLIDPDDTTKRITGTVTGAVYNGSQAGITVNGKNYPLGLIESIKQPGTEQPPAEGEGDAGGGSEEGDGDKHPEQLKA